MSKTRKIDQAPRSHVVRDLVANYEQADDRELLQLDLPAWLPDQVRESIETATSSMHTKPGRYVTGTLASFFQRLDELVDEAQRHSARELQKATEQQAAADGRLRQTSLELSAARDALDSMRQQKLQAVDDGHEIENELIEQRGVARGLQLAVEIQAAAMMSGATERVDVDDVVELDDDAAANLAHAVASELS